MKCTLGCIRLILYLTILIATPASATDDSQKTKYKAETVLGKDWGKECTSSDKACVANCKDGPTPGRSSCDVYCSDNQKHLGRCITGISCPILDCPH